MKGQEEIDRLTILSQQDEIERMRQLLEDQRVSYVRRIDESIKLEREIKRLKDRLNDVVACRDELDRKVADLERQLAEARLAIGNLVCPE